MKSRVGVRLDYIDNVEGVTTTAQVGSSRFVAFVSATNYNGSELSWNPMEFGGKVAFDNLELLLAYSPTTGVGPSGDYYTANPRRAFLQKGGDHLRLNLGHTTQLGRLAEVRTEGNLVVTDEKPWVYGAIGLRFILGVVKLGPEYWVDPRREESAWGVGARVGSMDLGVVRKNNETGLNLAYTVQF